MDDEPGRRPGMAPTPRTTQPQTIRRRLLELRIRPHRVPQTPPRLPRTPGPGRGAVAMMSAYELRRHLETAHDIPTRGLFYEHMLTLHDHDHRAGVAQNHSHEDDR